MNALLPRRLAAPGKGVDVAERRASPWSPLLWLVAAVLFSVLSFALLVALLPWPPGT